MDQSVFRPLHIASCQVVCSSCNLREICLPSGLTKSELAMVDERLVSVRRKVVKGDYLYRGGDPFQSLYAVWTGFFKTCVNSKEGRDQVTGFQMSGELMGLDGIGSKRHEVDAIALEDSQVCVIPFEDLEALSHEVASLQHHVHKVMSREIVRNHGVLLQLGSMLADERVAAFLLNLIYRLEARGFSGSSIVLRMSREEIGSFLGLKLETVSRTFSKFQAEGLLSVHSRQIEVTDAVGLQKRLDSASC